MCTHSAHLDAQHVHQAWWHSQACGPGTRKGETTGSHVPSHLLLHSKFKACENYTVPGTVHESNPKPGEREAGRQITSSRPSRNPLNLSQDKTKQATKQTKQEVQSLCHLRVFSPESRVLTLLEQTRSTGDLRLRGT